MNTCTVENCNRKTYGRGYCSPHYRRWKRHGDPQPDVPVRKAKRTVAERFWEKVAKSDGCWEWTGYRHPAGPGMLNVNRIPRYAHRISLELHGVTVPDGVEVDHICMNPPCVNPAHLRVATRKQNEENKPMRRNTASGYRGVSHFRETGKWRAHVTHLGKYHHLGFFSTPEEAAEVARQARNSLFTHNNDDRRQAA